MLLARLQVEPPLTPSGVAGARARPVLWALAVALAATLMPAAALAQRQSTRAALSRLEETLAIEQEDHAFNLIQLAPAIVVSTRPAFEATRVWFPNAALDTLGHVLGTGSLRACDACMNARLYVADGRIDQDVGDMDIAEIVKLDDTTRGSSAPARTAIWLDETPSGVSLRMVDLRNGRILVAQNFDPHLEEQARTERGYTATRDLERKIRGDALTQTFIDVAVYPSLHASLDFSEQWGETNANLSGASISAYDPVVGLGINYFRVVPQAFNIAVGGKLLMSLPTALVKSISNNGSGSVIDPLITGVFMVRVPIATTNYGVILSGSTNGRFGIGFSLMNLSLLPFLP